MRKTGKTTRLLDAAVQKLFTEGSVTIIGCGSDKEDIRGIRNIINGGEDLPNRYSFEEIFFKLKDRLVREHNQVFFTNQDTTDKPDRFIMIKPVLNRSFVSFKIVPYEKQ